MSHLRHYALPAALALLLCAAVWPTLRWVEFSSGSEQLVVAAALESQRDGSWQRRLVPSMNGEPRLRKPPITTWAAMAVVSTTEARALATGPIDEDAYEWAAVKIRTVSLFFGCATLLLTFELGRVLVDRRTGLVAMTICGSTYFFIEQNIRLTTDVTLATFVVATNVGLAHAFLRGRWMRGLAFAGMALGLAFLAKGPVGLVQSAVPTLVVIPFLMSRALPAEAGRPRKLPVFLGCLLGLMLFALIALPWFAYVLKSEPGAWNIWFTEVARTDESVPPSAPWDYFKFIGMVMPWTVFVVLGLLTGLAELLRRLWKRPQMWAWWLRKGRSFARLRGPGLVYATMLLVVPILIMACFRDRKDRYLLPMLPPACILAAEALRLVVRDVQRRPLGAKLAFGIHFALLLILCVGMPMATMVLVRDEYVDSAKWLSPTLGIPLMIGGAAVWVGGVWLTCSDQTRPLKRPRLGELKINTPGFLIATATCMAFATNVFLAGYGDSREAMADMKPLAAVIRREVPDAALYHGVDGVHPGFLIYAGRSTKPLPEVLDRSRPSVYIVRQRDVQLDKEPTMPLPWKVLTTARRDKSIWWAFVLEASDEARH